MTALTFGPRIPHDGGPCPVAPDTVVKVWRRIFGVECVASGVDAHICGWPEVFAYAVAQPQPARAAPAPEAWTPYTNRIRTDLLTPEELAAMQAHDGPWEVRAGRTWHPMEDGRPLWITSNTYRAVSPPETREVVMYLGLNHAGDYVVNGTGWPADTHTFTLTIDATGEPVAVGGLRRKDQP